MMKNLFLLLSALLFTCSGVWATEVTTVSTAGTPLTLAQLEALSGTGGHVAFANLGSGQWTNKWLANPSNNSDLTLSKVQLYTITNGNVSDKYFLQCVNDNKYRTNSGWGDLSDAENIEFKIYDGGITVSCDNPISIHNNSGTQWNINYGSFGGALNGWAAYAAYGPFYIMEVNCIDDASGTIFQTITKIVKESLTMDIPVFSGKNLKDGEPTSIEINGADAVYNLHYVSESYDYNVVITGDELPTGTEITIKGGAVTNGATVSYATIVEENDVEVTYPTGYEYMVYSVTISSTTITIKCYDPRWSVNFEKDATHSRNDRSTTYVKLGDETISFTGQSSTPRLIYNDETAQHFTQPAGATVTPTFGFIGNAMMGYVYIDYNNDGDFTDDGELVSYWNTGYATDQLQQHDRQTPPFTLTSTPGSYRARFKVDWNNTNPGGTGPAGISNYIGDNGGAVIDVMIDVKDYYEPITNQFYRFKIGDKYMCNVADENVRTATTTNNDASTIFYLNSSNQLIAYADGFGFNYSYCKAGSPGIFNSFSFLESSVANSYFIHANPGTESNEYSNRYITINSNKLDEGRGQWSIEEVEALPVTISDVGYATLYSPVALTIPDGVDVYTASNEGTYLRLNEITGQTIPANTGVILAGNEGSYNFNFTDPVFPITGNVLTGTVAAIAKPEGAYYLSNGDYGLGFYKAGTATTLAGFKAYLPAENAVKGFLPFDFGTLDGIQSMDTRQENVIYNLAGLRLNKLQKGLNIVNGKKVLVK